jgi:predicted phage terminase large subunit-like protein
METTENTLSKNSSFEEEIVLFIRKAFNIVDSGTDYLHSWHIDLIGAYLSEIYKGNIKRLIINIPPRTLKSICVSVAFPAWLLGKNPSSRIIVASYSKILSLKHSTDCRLVIQSDWYKQKFPNVTLNTKQNEKHKFATTKNGYRFATSVEGTLTGEGGNYLIVDDPHNPQQVMSEKYRKKTLDWFSNTLSSRLNDKKKGVIIIVMQRLHPNDLTGYLLDKGKNLWQQISIPAIAEKDELLSIGNFTKFRHRGELLHPKREGIKEIEQIKIEMGSYVFSAQYQQNPVLIKIGMLEPNWIQRYQLKNIATFQKITLSFDTAIKAGIKNDPTVCTVWGEKQNNYYLLEVYREWLEYPALKKIAIELIKKWNPDNILIEDKASGQSLIQDLRQDIKQPVIPIKANKDKITRFASVSTFIEAGRVFLPNEAVWLADFENELYSFPNHEHDDQVDSLSQFLNWIKSKCHKSPINIKRL